MKDKTPQVTNIKDAQTLINQLWEITLQQSKTIDVLTHKIDSLTIEANTLKEKLSKNSNNSNKPPSSNSYSKPTPKKTRKTFWRSVSSQRPNIENSGYA